MVETTRHDLVFTWGGILLAGTLHLPPAPPPHPCVLMLQGAGPADRDARGDFPPIRDAFLARGIATFSFDKPGIGGSTGDWRHYALFDRADQAIAALALLREHAAIAPQRVGVWGQSQGGWVVQIIASRLPDLACAIANSGPAIGVAAQNRYGCAQTMRAAGKPDEQIARALTYIEAVEAAAARGDDYATVEEQLLVGARGAPWYGYLTIGDAVQWGLIRRYAAERYDPAAALARARCPFLAVFGARDVYLPAWESAQTYGQMLHEAGNGDATIVVYPQGDHRIMVEEGDAFCTGYLDLLGDWVGRRMAA